jgi:hypothetical protein
VISYGVFRGKVRPAGLVRFWIERPYLLVFPAIGVVAAIVAAESMRRRWDAVPDYIVASSW